jgi:uncharacterized protein (DUF2267 family)
MPFDELLRRVAERAGLDRDDARRAVFATPREAISDEEFFDVTVQLPKDYTVLLARP